MILVKGPRMEKFDLDKKHRVDSVLAIFNKVSQFLLSKLLSSSLSLCFYSLADAHMCVVARKKVCILFWQKCTFNNDVHTLVCCFYSINALLASPKEREKGSLFFINSIKVQPLLFKGIWNLIQLWTYVHFMEQEMKKKNHLLWSANNTNWYESKASLLYSTISETQ